MTSIDELAHASAWRGRAVAEKGAIALVFARVPLGPYARVLAVPLGFVALSGVAIAVVVTRDAGGIHVGFPRAALLDARAVTCRALGATAAALLLPLTTPVPQIVGALRALGVPREIVETMVLLYRFVFALEGAARATLRAQTARLGFVSRRAAQRSVGLFAATLFGRAMDRAARLDRALASRGGSESLATLKTARSLHPGRVAAFALLYGAAAFLSILGPAHLP